MSPEKRRQVEAEGAKRGPRRSFSCWHPVLAFSRTRRKCWGYFTYGTVLWRPLQRNTVMMLLLAKLPFAQCDITAVNENVHLETCALRKLVFMNLYELQLNNHTVPITICKLAWSILGHNRFSWGFLGGMCTPWIHMQEKQNNTKNFPINTYFTKLLSDMCKDSALSEAIFKASFLILLVNYILITGSD